MIGRPTCRLGHDTVEPELTKSPGHDQFTDTSSLQVPSSAYNGTSALEGDAWASIAGAGG